MSRPVNRNWIWLFVVIFVLAVIAIGINLAFNMRQQLSAEDLKNARALWEKNGPKDYDLVIRKEIGVDRPDKDVVRSKVRGGRVTEARLNDQALEPRLWADYDMPAWFDFIDRFWEMDHKPGAPRSFCRAQFDPKDGHIKHYVRSVRELNQRQELTIELTPANP